MANARPAASRPLSPHLSIYRPILTMVMSIMHRMTGGALYFGTLLIAWWLSAAAAGEPYFDFVNGLFASIPGRLVLFGFTWALMHHGLGGVRHLIWDTGHGFSEAGRRGLSWATLIGGFVLTFAIWAAAYMARGGLT